MLNKLISKLISPLGSIILIICIGLATKHYLSSKPIIESTNNASTQALFAAEFPDENGQMQSISQWQGKIIVLNFWATWCPPCREEMPELSALNSEYNNKNVIVLGIAIDEIPLIKEFTEETPVSYPLLAAENGGMELGASLGNNKGVLPYTLIIKPDGSVAKTYFGRITKPLLEETIKTLL